MSMTTRSMLGEFNTLKSLNSSVVAKVKEYYQQYHWPEDIHDFTETRTEDEYQLIKKCCDLIPNYGKRSISLIAVLWYYYSVVVLEHYVTIGLRTIVNRKYFHECHEKYMKISCSSEKWASDIRRLILKLD
jgi:hypothetical protein